MSVLTTSNFSKLCLLSSVAMVGLLNISGAAAGGIPVPPLPPVTYPVPLPPVLPPVLPPALPPALPPSDSDFYASIEASASYQNQRVISCAVTCTKNSAQMELRPYIAYNSNNNGLDFSASLTSSLLYEFGGTPAFTVGYSQGDFLVKRSGDFAFGISGGYDKKSFASATASPIGQGSYNVIDGSVFAEKIMGNFGLSLTANYAKENYNPTLQTTGSFVGESARDNSSYGVKLRANAHINQAITVFAEGQYQRQEFVVPAVPSNNDSSYGIRLGGTYNFNNQLALEVAGQYALRKFDGAAANSQHAFGGDAKLVASFGQGVSGSVSAGTEYIKNTSAGILNSKRVSLGADIGFEAAHNIKLTAGLKYDLTFAGPSKGQSLTTDARIDYALNENIDLFASAFYDSQSNSVPIKRQQLGAKIGIKLHN